MMRARIIARSLLPGRPDASVSARTAMTFGAVTPPAALCLRCGMFARLNHSRLLRYAGLFTWAVVGMPLLLLSLMPADQAALGEEAVADRPYRLAGVAGLRRVRRQLRLADARAGRAPRRRVAITCCWWC